MLISVGSGVYAEEVFVNSNGGVLSIEEYEYLRNYFSENYINNLSVDGINELKKWNEIQCVEDEKIFRVDSFYDNYGNVISTTQVEITENQANELLNSVKNSTRSNSDTHTTSMKKITLTLNVGSATDEIAVILKNQWLSIPSVKSYDIIAFRPVSNFTYQTINSLLSSAYQYSGSDKYSYDLSSSNNVKKSKNISGTGGYGVSMNIPDDASGSLSHELTVVYNFVEPINSSSNYFIVEGTYQHATSSISLSDSKKYSFGATGMGGVLVFDSSTIKNKYDNTDGLYVKFEF